MVLDASVGPETHHGTGHQGELDQKITIDHQALLDSYSLKQTKPWDDAKLNIAEHSPPWFLI